VDEQAAPQLKMGSSAADRASRPVIFSLFSVSSRKDFPPAFVLDLLWLGRQIGRTILRWFLRHEK
jgi:hypothetical protein